MASRMERYYKNNELATGRSDKIRVYMNKYKT